MGVIRSLVTILILGVGLLGFMGIRFLTQSAQNGLVAPVIYEVKPLMKFQAIANDLDRLGVVSSSQCFYWYGRLSGKSAKIKSGEYRFTGGMRPGEVMAILMSGISYGLPVTVPEGYSMVQVADVVEQVRPGSKKRFLKLCTDQKFIAGLGFDSAPHTLEGYLFPDTYLLGRTTPEEELIRHMVKHYRAVFTPEFATRAAEIGMTEHQVITLASIVEKETGADEERPLISSVFHNRLKKKMRLQTDPTVVYGIKNYNGNITRRDLETYSPYNTYLIPGLPPGPIANPGKAAIRAALYPAESSYLYFVSHNDGTHEFTSTYEDHRKAVERFQMDPKAREGKSWRDLNRKNERQRRAAAH